MKIKVDLELEQFKDNRIRGGLSLELKQSEKRLDFGKEPGPVLYHNRGFVETVSFETCILLQNQMVCFCFIRGSY
jgi:hypothetical protein